MPMTDMKLCVIDDIRSVVEMITTRIPWGEHGITIAGSALDGEEGLALVSQVRPDIVLSDIRMPKLDGLEMTRRILEFSPQSKVIILSAYTDFAYAQQAIRLGAFDFVKKPFSMEEIIAVVVKARDARAAELAEQAQVQAMEKRIKDSMPVLRQEYFQLLMHHQTDIISAMKRWEFLHMEMEPRHVAVLIAEIDQFSERYQGMPVQEMELIRFSLQNIMEETVQGYTKGIIFRESLNRYVCVINSSDDHLVSLVADACCANIAKYTKFTISIGVGLAVEAVNQLSQSYQQALKALSYHFYTGGNGALSFATIAGGHQSIPEYSHAEEQEFLFALRSGNRERSLLLLESLLDNLAGSGTLSDPGDVGNICYELASKLFRVLLEIFPYEQLEPFENKLEEIRKKDEVSSSFLRLRSLLLELVAEGCEWIESNRKYESKRIIHEAKDYIRGHLHQDLSLEHCARQFNFSPGYFSNLFRKEAGMPFQQFVIQEKIERAKTMLIQDHQVQEIAQELGYEHRRYFSEVFKKSTGMTPSQFRESYLGRPPTS
ncbi:MAG: AraC family transcriptional regulator [Paenibacillaceae bacterium]|jgi:two-component system response regulator YesN|nr:AraC family transcriptional regulator [Paenibacillaceae bacterium]